MTEVVLPNDANPMGMLAGGRIIQWMDIACAIVAQTHSGKVCVTASVDQVAFKNPARVGDIVLIKARITRAFNSSMEIHVQAWSRRVISKEENLINEAWFTFVALNENGKPAEVPPVKPENAEEKRLFNSALQRRKSRLTLK